jgi:hypothetical protein
MNDFNLELFLKIADLIKYCIYKLNSAFHKPTPTKYINICCDKDQIDYLLPVMKLIAINNPKPASYTDMYYNIIIYVLVLYLYYSLVLGEQSDDLLDSTIIQYVIYKNSENKKESKEIYTIISKLYLNICTSNELLYYSQVRRYFFGMNTDIDIDIK